MKKLSCIAAIILAVSFVFASCGVNDPTNVNDASNTNDSNSNIIDYSSNDTAESNPTESEPAENVDVSDNHTVSLTEISQSDVIPYENFSIRGPYYTNTSGSLYIPFSYNSRYGYSDQDGNPVIENLDYAKFNNFSEGFAFYVSENKSYVIDSTGKTVFTLPDNASFSPFKDGYSVILRKESISDTYNYNIYICILDKNMNFTESKIMVPNDMFIESDLEYWYPVNENGYQGALGIIYDSETVYYAVVNSSGNIVASFNADSAYSSVRSAFSCVNISPSVKQFYPNSKYDIDLTKIIFIKNGYANVMDENNKWGLMNLETEKLVIDYSYDFVGAYSDGLIPICKYGTWGAIDIDGNTVIPCKNFKYIGAFVNNRAIALSENENLCIIDNTGNIISEVNVSISQSNWAGNSIKSFFYTDFTETTHIACIYLSQYAYIISDSGELLLYITPGEYGIDNFLYMNNDYLVCNEKNGYRVYRINH